MEKTMLAARQEVLRKALVLMDDALRLLDEADCSADVGAHLDLAMSRLRDLVPEVLPPTDVDAVARSASSRE